MFDTIYLHAGLPKTGSTHLQLGMQFLSNAGLLTRVAYPDAHPEIGPGNGATTSDVTCISVLDESVQARLDACIGDLLAANRGDANDLLISSEHFFFATPVGFGCLKEKLLSHARSVKLLVCVRPLRQWVWSLYMQGVKAHAESARFDGNWLEECGATYLPNFMNLDRFDTDAVVFAYRESGLLPLFLRFMGEDEGLASQFPDVRVNRSLGSVELDLVRRINSVFHDETLCRTISTRFIDRSPGRASARFPEDSEEHFQRFAAGFASELDRLHSPLMRKVRELLFAEMAVPDGTCTDSGDVPARSPEMLETLDFIEIALHDIGARQIPYRQDGQHCRGIKDYAACMQPTSEFFDPIHYLLMYPDLCVPDVDPEVHYRNHGREEGRASGLKSRHIKRS